MATHKSAEKRARQSLKKEERNTGTKNAIKTFEKKVRTALATKDAKAAGDALVGFASKIDKAAQKGIIPRKTASRKISRLSTQVSALK